MKQTDLKRKAYEYLKNKIIRCELLPEQDISEEEIIGELGISRTPLREALIRLEQENFVNIYPRKGIVISGISINVINDIFQVREIIEPQVVKIVADNISTRWLADMKKRFASIGTGESAFWENIDLDNEFHSFLIDTTGNSYLVRMISNINDHKQRMRVLSYRMSNRIAVSNREHNEIIDALYDRDADRAETCMRNHIINARNAALNLKDKI